MTNGRDRLRELLDAVLDEQHVSLNEMAEGAHTTRFHFAHEVSSASGEAPVAMRRRIILERAAWQLREGTGVTDAAWSAGYESAEGFSRAFARAFGYPPSSVTEEAGGRHWLPSSNGIHFHPPMSLWVQAQEASMNPLTEQLVRHDIDDVDHLIEVAARLDEDDLRHPLLPGNTVLEWDGEEPSIAAVLEALVYTKEVWLASIEGLDLPASQQGAGIVELRGRHRAVASRWISAVRDIDRRGAWNDRLVDALCEPPESFMLSAVVAHVLTFSTYRRQLVRQMMRSGGRRIDDGDPIIWLRRLRGEHDANTNEEEGEHP